MVLFKRGSWKFWFGLVISLVFLWLAFAGQNFGEIWQAWTEFNYWWLIPALVAYFAGVYVRAVRWHFLLRPLQNINSRRLFPVVVIGYMANNVLPARMGEVVRAYVLNKREKTTKTGTLATIVVERIMDGITMLFFLAILSFFVKLSKELQGVEIIAGVVFSVAIVAFFVLAGNRGLMLKAEQLGLRFMPRKIRPKVEGLANKFIDGLQILRQWRDLLAVFGLSVVAWLCEAAMYWFVAVGFANLNLDWRAILMAVAVANLFTIIPSSPGFVGPFDYAAKTVLTGAFGIAGGLAASYVIMLHAALYFPVTLLGLYFWLHEHFSFKEAEESRRIPAAEIPDAELTQLQKEPAETR
jgi:glycosyltransferase 2 family protein